MNTDQFGAPGKSKETQLLNIVSTLETLIAQKNFSDEDKLILIKNTLFNEIQKLSKKNSKTYRLHLNFTKTYRLHLNFINRLEIDIKTLDDVVTFCIAMKYVVAPINRAMLLVPSNDKNFCETIAKNILDTFGEEKIALLISTWDNLGVKGCLDVERALVVEEFANFLKNLSSLEIPHTKFEDDIMSTAFVQEFERRLGQKRKSRGGNSLETVTDFIFDYYGFESTKKPTHFAADLEIDKWFKCKDNWIIGISCKRTLRERWKQLSQADKDTLSKFKIREIWHLITYDNDLSDDKILKLGEQGQIFYLPNTSETYKKCLADSNIKNYIRPLNLLIENIRNSINLKA